MRGLVLFLCWWVGGQCQVSFGGGDSSPSSQPEQVHSGTVTFQQEIHFQLVYCSSKN